MCDIGVLVFVDEDIFETLLVVGEHVRVFAEQPDCLGQQVTKIHRVERLQAVLIELVQFATLAIPIGTGVALGNLVRRQTLVFPAIDHSGQQARRPALVVNSLGADQLFQKPDLVVGIENGEVGFQPHEFCVATQYLDADRVECTKPWHALNLFANIATYPLLHLARRLVGKGDGEDLRWPGQAGGKDMGNARGQHTRLARTGTCQHQ